MDDQRINQNSGTMQRPRLPYARPQLVELDLTSNTDGKRSFSTQEGGGTYAPS